MFSDNVIVGVLPNKMRAQLRHCEHSRIVPKGARSNRRFRLKAVYVSTDYV